MYQQPIIDAQETVLHVSLGHSVRDPEKHCSDGDSPYISGSFRNTLVRLVGIDAFEVRDNQDTYNLKLIRAGWAHPYFIYPNAVQPAEEGEWCICCNPEAN